MEIMTIAEAQDAARQMSDESLERLIQAFLNILAERGFVYLSHTGKLTFVQGNPHGQAKEEGQTQA
jgi:hypothetical protein